MKLHINESPAVALKWIDDCILSKTTDNFVKVASTFAILNFKDTIDAGIISAMQAMADKDGYVNIDNFCDNLVKAIDTVGDSVNIPLSMFVNIPFVSKLTINVTKQDIDVMRDYMNEKGVK